MINDEMKKFTDNNDASIGSTSSGVTAASAIAALRKAAEEMFSEPMCNCYYQPNILNIGITMNH